MRHALRLEDVFAFDGRFYSFLDQVATCKDIGYLRHAFDTLARLYGPDAPRPWPFDAGFLPTAGEARQAVIAMFWLLEYETRDPSARHHGVDPNEWILELEDVGNAHRKRVAVGSRNLIAKTQRARRARQKGGRTGAEKRADWFKGQRDDARAQAVAVWNAAGKQNLSVSTVARFIITGNEELKIAGNADLKHSTVRAWIGDLRPTAG